MPVSNLLKCVSKQQILTKVLFVICLDALILSLFRFSFFFVTAGAICVIIQMSDTSPYCLLKTVFAVSEHSLISLK